MVAKCLNALCNHSHSNCYCLTKLNAIQSAHDVLLPIACNGKLSDN